MAAKVQRIRAYRLGGANLYLWAGALQPAAPTHLPRHLGHGTVPSSTGTRSKCCAVAVGDARVVPSNSAPRLAVCGRPVMEAPTVFLAPIGTSGRHSHR